MIKKCGTCVKYEAKNAVAPKVSTPTPTRPWQVIAADVFTLHGHDYLVVGDYYSKTLFVRRYAKGQIYAKQNSAFLKGKSPV